MKNLLVVAFVLFSGIIDAQASDPYDGFAVVRSDTIYGKLKINFDAGSILVKQDSINRMFLSGIELITLLNEDRETYIPIDQEGKSVFFQVLVQGDQLLLEYEDSFYTFVEGELLEILEEKDLYDLFGKKEVKNYIFVRNIILSDTRGMMDVFNYFNSN